MQTPPSDATPAPTLERFTRDEVLHMVGITAQEMRRWQRLRLVEPREVPGKRGEKVYLFEDLIGLRTIKQLTSQGVTTARLLEAVEAVRRQAGRQAVSLAELHIMPLCPAGAGGPVDPNRLGRLNRSGAPKVTVEVDGKTLEPLSGQLVFTFDAGETRLRVMKERTVEEWLQVAAQCEGNPELRPQAIGAYLQVVEADPQSVEAHINLGTLFYEDGQLEEAKERFRLVLTLAPDNALAHFNLGSVLDELKEVGEACQCLREAVRLKPDYADAHYNLARVYEELGAYQEARPHWRRYLELDPHSSWADYARQRLATSRP